jgi:lipoyl synthase
VSEAEALFRLPWSKLQSMAWEVRRRYHENTLAFAVPGMKRYDTEQYRNRAGAFPAVSLTGDQCARDCEHCGSVMLRGMTPATSPADLLSAGEWVLEHGGAGMLISGGCDEEGALPLQEHLAAIAGLKAAGLQVVIHTGLLDRQAAGGLKAAGVDQVLLDVVGDEQTIREVLHLSRVPADYASTLALLRDLDIATVPHVVAGLYYGQLRGELAALEMLRLGRLAAIVLVALRPLAGTSMAALPSVSPEEMGRLVAVARILFPTTPLTLGCARPAGAAGKEMERLALLAGVNAIAYPDPVRTADAEQLGLRTLFVERCCSLVS